jgi:hypothetical protein
MNEEGIPLPSTDGASNDGEDGEAEGEQYRQGSQVLH